MNHKELAKALARALEGCGNSIEHASATWQQHLNSVLTLHPAVDRKKLELARILTSPRAIDGDEHEIRLGELGRYDVYFTLTQDLTGKDVDALLLSGLTAEEVAATDWEFSFP